MNITVEELDERIAAIDETLENIRGPHQMMLTIIQNKEDTLPLMQRIFSNDEDKLAAMVADIDEMKVKAEYVAKRVEVIEITREHLIAKRREFA